MAIKQTAKIVTHLDSIRGMLKIRGSDALVTISEDCLVKFWGWKQVTGLGENEHMDPVRTFREHTGPIFGMAGGPSPFNPE